MDGEVIHKEGITSREEIAGALAVDGWLFGYITTYIESRQDKEMEINQDLISVKTDNPTKERGEDGNQSRENEQAGERQEVTGRETTAPLADAVTQLSALLTRAKISDGAEATIPPFDGTYSAIQFFQAFDRKMEDASMGEQEKLLRLPNYLVRQPLELFSKLRMADRSYFQVRQILLDLYPESSEASFAKYFAMKLTGQANLETYYREKTAMGLQLGLPQESGSDWYSGSTGPVYRQRDPEKINHPQCRVRITAHPDAQVHGMHLFRRPTASSAARGTGTANADIDQSRRPTKKCGQCKQSQNSQSRVHNNQVKPETPQPSRLFETENGIIEQSFSPFSSPVTLVTKRDKTKRFCIDYRKVNELISSDAHPLPRIEGILDRLAQAKYFSTADISSAYWQVPIHPDSRPLLAFATLEGLYQPTRLPFGLKTSPQIYERAKSQVLQRHGLDCVAHYFDDFIIYSNTLEEHQNHLRQFFAFCEAEKLQLNFVKCEFFKQSIDFLGYTITAGTITPLTRNTDIIHAIKQPHNRKTLQFFLGAVNVYNKFIPEYARLRAPLNNLLKKDVVWNWNEVCQEAFIDLKGNLTQHPILHLYKEGPVVSYDRGNHKSRVNAQYFRSKAGGIFHQRKPQGPIRKQYLSHRKRRQFKQTDAFTRGMVIGLKRAARVDRRILRQAVAAPQATCTAILQHVQDTLDHSISTRTISRRLVANGLYSCRPLRRLPLTPPNRRQRLEWCRARSTWMTEWHRVVFSDESRFCLSSDSRRVRVWRRRG
ncbi:hypothetical protein LAZ67_7002248 [Cordylochernes scorpioides]|uniref:Reverse transcriptase domain-containing protein n=1 Tax=Cordylochernes scorpioides TaxID=51811 RepID=A0ABY6KQY4_9ARAC|nr:hypothetical protein LAZ67_7002248 [Cordylochernes scorpioides]